MPTIDSALQRAARLHAAASIRVRRMVGVADGFVAGVLDAALTDLDKTTLGVSAYADSPSFRDAGQLFEWEARWLGEVLPSPPAHVLVGGCGAGRELIALERAGFVVDGFEPADPLRALARSRVPDARLSADTWQSWAARPDTTTYDAILFGWGSLSHILSPSEREWVMRAASRRCPDGPILISYWATGPNTNGRARRIGAAIGAQLARARGVPSTPSGDPWMPATGFIHPLSSDEIESLARSAGRVARFDWRAGEYPHATLLPQRA